MIKNRTIFYISGFDPRGLRFYRGILKQSITDYMALSGENITMNTQKTPLDTHHINIVNHTKGTHNQYHFLGWDDIVRTYWTKNPVLLLGKTLIAYYGYAKNIMWNIVPALPRGPVITLFFPIVTLLLIWTFLTIILSVGAGFITDSMHKIWISALIASIPSAYILNKIKSLWLLRFFIFNVHAFDKKPDLLNARIDDFVGHILAALNNSDIDEIQLIAHSNGSILMIPLLSRLFEKIPPEQCKKLKILTLGQCIPLASYYRGAVKLRHDLNMLKQKNFVWHDFSSPADGVCFALHNPFKPDDNDVTAQIRLKSPQFHKYFSKSDYAKLRQNKFEMHFQYLKTAPILSPYNIVRIMTDTVPLETYFCDDDDAKF